MSVPLHKRSENKLDAYVKTFGACQKGKGTTFVLNDFKRQLQKYYRKHGNDNYYLKCDIHHFFESINHDILKDKLAERIDDEHILHIGDADAVYFCKGWEQYRGCTIEHECAVRYGKMCIYA